MHKSGKTTSICAVFGAIASLATAQTVDQTPTAPASPSNPPNNSEQVVMMSQFEVTTTQGAGYVADNSARGMKTDQPLIDIPQADIVVTNDFINDTGYYNSSDVLRFVGVAAQYRGEALSQRGTRDQNSYFDDMRDPSEGYQDECIVDSYDVIKGPAAVLYQNASLSGVIVKNSKKPLPYEEASISESIQEWGQSRTVLDFNVPLGQIQDTTFTFRFIGAVQVGDLYWQNYTDHRYVMHPMLAINYKNNTVRIAYDFENLYAPPEPQGLMTLNGGLWTGWGRNFDGMPPGDSSSVINQHQAIRLEWLNKISESW
jgi:iron complex outermembrane receptor protein